MLQRQVIYEDGFTTVTTILVEFESNEIAPVSFVKQTQFLSMSKDLDIVIITYHLAICFNISKT